MPLRQPEASAAHRGPGSHGRAEVWPCTPACLFIPCVCAQPHPCARGWGYGDDTVSCPQGAHSLVAGDTGRQIITVEPRLRGGAWALQAPDHSDTVRNYVGVSVSSGHPSSSPLPCRAE